jgi:hypothetical protein
VRRDIFEAEALAWLAANPSPPHTSIVTSLPDVSEVPMGFDAWRAWFIDAARAIVRWLPDEGVAIFFQSDVLHRGAWIDKGYLVARAVELESAHHAFHKIVCRKPPGVATNGRASYSHLLAASRVARRASTRPTPDVLPDAGFMPRSKAMGVAACELACRWLANETSTRTIVDPFCGHGTALAVANAMGFDAIGVDTSARQCRAARKLRVTP